MTDEGFKKLLKKHRWDGSKLPKGLTVEWYLNLGDTKLKSLPEGLRVDGDLNLFNCKKLTALPNGLKVKGYLDIQGCTALTELPKGLTVGDSLNLEGCTGLTSLPNGLKVGGSLNLQSCTALTKLPNGLTIDRYLNLGGCTGLTSLPKGLTVKWNLYFDPHHVVYEGVKAERYFVSDVLVPESLAKRRLEYKEFKRLNAEQRQVWIRMVGVEWLVKNAKPEILDVDDHKINGHRALMLVQDERTRYCVLVCGDPSTGRVYYMEVPPKTKTCQEADSYLNWGLDQRQQVGRT